jgi:hypothetical protein
MSRYTQLSKLQQPVVLQAYWVLLVTTAVSGACSSVGSLGASVSVEREWPKVLCGSNTAALSKINSGVLEAQHHAILHGA